MDTEKTRTSVGLRLVVIGALSIALLIPALMIEGLIREREVTRNRAIIDVSDKWGGRQLIAGPVLTVPIKKRHTDDKGRVSTSIIYSHFLPDDLLIKGNISPTIRHRGIYDVVLYNGKLNISGNFPLPAISGLDISKEEIMWKDAFLSLGICDMKGIKDSIKIRWNGSDLTANPGIESNDVLSSGISAKAPLYGEKESYAFSLDVDINGSQELKFVPVGKTTRVVISSGWKDPSFQGVFLPEKSVITKSGFTAEWKVLQLNRNYPQKWVGKSYDINTSSFGVNLLLLVDGYQKTSRSLKYALLFIGLTFSAFFVIEILHRKAIHPIQYLLIGFALVLFYTLLLSLSEHIGFDYSYLTAATGIVLMIAAYTKSVLSSRTTAAAIGGILSVLYGLLYILLQIEDFALLLGSSVLFIVLGLFMYLTRKINWYLLMKDDVKENKEQVAL